MEIRDKKLFWNVDENLTGLKLSHAIATKGGDTVVGQGNGNTTAAGGAGGQYGGGGGGGSVTAGGASLIVLTWVHP
jgi:hypothetical protein